MKLMYWVLPTEMPAVGMIVSSVGAMPRLAMICLEKLYLPGMLGFWITGEPP